MMELKALKMKETPKDWVDWKTQTTYQKRHKTYMFFLPWTGDNLLHDNAIDGGEPGARIGGRRRRQVPDDGELV